MGTYSFHRGAIVLTTLLAVTAVVIAGCSSAQATLDNPPSPQAATSAQSGAQSIGTGGGNASSSAGATQSSSGGNVTIEVTWENPRKKNEPLTFSVDMNTHSVDLDGVDLGKLAVLRNDAGQEVKPQQWEAPAGGHHRSGTLIFPFKDESGKPIVGTGTKTLEMVIRDVAGVKERVLQWKVS